MIIHNVTQGSPEWHRLRLGIPTASNFDKIITPAKGEPTTGETRRRYMNELLCERALGISSESFTSAAMEHGHEYEPEAIANYEYTREVDTIPVGFITNDAGTIGASPDRLIGDDGQIEVKCPHVPAIHMEYLRAAHFPEAAKSLGQKYRPQVQGQLWITGRSWSDTLSYHPQLGEAVIRVARDEQYIAKLESAVTLFSRDLESEWAQLSQACGFTDKRLVTPKADDSVLGISQEDIDILTADMERRGVFTS